jgi:hypothetical protein
MTSDSLPEPYRWPAKPVTYKGVEMRSQLEAQTARALDRIGVAWHYEPTRYADESGQFTPDFKLPSVRVVGWRAIPRYTTPLHIEARPSHEEQWRRKNERDAAILAHSSDDPLLFVGLGEMAAALLGWCYGIKENEPVLAVLGEWREIGLDGLKGQPPEPCLYVDAAAAVWVDGYWTGTFG